MRELNVFAARQRLVPIVIFFVSAGCGGDEQDSVVETMEAYLSDVPCMGPGELHECDLACNSLYDGSDTSQLDLCLDLCTAHPECTGEANVHQPDGPTEAGDGR